MLKPCELEPALDAVMAAPDFHTILFENEHVRVLNVVIEPGAKEPFHTHIWQSIFIVPTTPRLNYFIPEVELPLFEIPSQSHLGVLHLAPEGLHSLENVDNRRLKALRIEMKQAPLVDKRNSVPGPILDAGDHTRDPYLDNDIVRICSRNPPNYLGAHLAALAIRGLNGESETEWIQVSDRRSDFSEQEVVILFKYLDVAK